MCKKICIFVDWDNLKRDIESIIKPSKIDGVALIKFIKKFRQNDETIHKIYFYTAKPLTKREIKIEVTRAKNKIRDDKTRIATNKHLSDRDKALIEAEPYLIKALDNLINNNDTIYNEINYFLSTIQKEQLVILKLGRLIIDPYSKSLFKQKQVDTSIVAGIAHIAYNKFADSILLFSNDKDLAPALKIARVNGLNVFLANIKGNKYKRAKDLVRHSDDIRTESLIDDPYINYTTS